MVIILKDLIFLNKLPSQSYHINSCLKYKLITIPFHGKKKTNTDV